MTRAARFFSFAAAIALVWTLLMVEVLPLPVISLQAKHEILPAIPWWILVSTGSYLLYQIGWGLFTFNDVPKAYDDLMIDIKNAKDFLGSRGVQID